MNIVISVNQKYIAHAKMMLFSLKKHCREEISVWLINHSIDAREFKDVLESSGFDFHEIKMGESMFDSMPLCYEDLFSIETYYRILIPWLLPESAERALWLDADILIRGDIAEFYHQDFQGYSVSACLDGCGFYPELSLENNRRLQIDPTHQYFNAGVLLMNLNRIRKQYTTDQIFAIANSLKKHLKFPDQDILNFMFAGDVLYADSLLYNCAGYIAALHLRKDQLAQVKILHYYGADKPWKLFSGFDPGMIYWRERYGCAGVFPYSLQRVLFLLKQLFRKVPWIMKCYHRIKGDR